MKHHPKPLLLIFPFGLLSHYLRCLVIAKHLSPYFKIKFVSHNKYNHFLEKEGFGVFECDSMNEDEAIAQVKEFDFAWLNEQDIEKSFISQAVAINKHRPTAVLGDAVPTLKMAAEYTGVTYISLHNAYMSKLYGDTRSLSKTHPAFPLVAKLPEKIRELLTEFGEAVALKKVHKPFNIVRARYNLQQFNSYLDEIEGDHNLVCDLPYIFPLKNTRQANYTCIGPLLYNGNLNPGTFSSNELNRSKKTIFISMGSTGDWKKVKIFNDVRFKKYNIVTAGDSGLVLNAPHIISKGFIAADELLPYTDLVICHGGNGTIYQALSYGIPLLCAAAHFEQEWNVAALEKKGLAASIDAIVEPAEFEQAVDNRLDKKDAGIYTFIKEKIEHSTNRLHERAEETASIILELSCSKTDRTVPAV